MSGLSALTTEDDSAAVVISMNYPPHSVETTVLMVNIWAPAVALKLRATGEARIEFSAFLPTEPKHRSMELEQRPALKATTVVKLMRDDSAFLGKSSALRQEGRERLLTIARKISTTEDYQASWEGGLSSGDPVSNAFARGQSPLNWLDPRNDSDDGWDVESKFYIDAKAMVHPGSALYRMMTFTELRYELCGVTEKPERTSRETLDAYFDLLDKCEPSERHFQIVALNAVAADGLPVVRVPDVKWSELCEEIRRRVPAYSMYFNAAGNFRAISYSTVSLLGHSGGSAKEDARLRFKKEIGKGRDKKWARH